MEAYSLTYFRVAAFAWMALVFAGLILISWLGSAASVVAVAVTYAVFAVPFLAGWTRAVPLAIAGGAVLLGASQAGGAVFRHSCDAETAYYCIQIDDIAFLHGMSSKSNTHGPGCVFMGTGHATEGFPAAGAWSSYALGSLNDQLPTYVAIPDIRGGG